MNDGHPEDGNEGLFSSLLKKISGKVKKDDDVTEEEIMDMVNEGHEQGVLKENEAEMIGNIFEFGEKHASDVMTHRKNIVGIECSSTVDEAFSIMMRENYSRYPVYDGDIDNIIGILHIRDLLKAYVDEENRNKKLIDMKHQLLFDASYIPETRNISVLFKEMQTDKVHMAIVVDEYGQTAGLVTMEDILEEIVGNIFDEYDDDEVLISRQQDGSYIIDGQTLLEDIEDAFDMHFDCDDIDTINGYLIYKMGKIPQDNERFECSCDGYCFKVLEVENKMITKVSARKEELPERRENE